MPQSLELVSHRQMRHTEPEERSRRLCLVTALGASRRDAVGQDVCDVAAAVHSKRNCHGNPSREEEKCVQSIEDDDQNRRTDAVRRERRCGDGVKPRQKGKHSDENIVVDLRRRPPGRLICYERPSQRKDNDCENKLETPKDPAGETLWMHR